MKPYFLSQVLILICIAISFGHKAYSQDTAQTTRSANLPKHHAGWIFSYAAGTPTTGREAMMISTMYAYSLEDWCDIEASVHYLGRSWRGEFIGLGRLHTTSWTLEAAPMVRLSKEGFFQAFRVGIGVSVQSLRYLENIRDFFDPTLEYAVYSNVVYVGGTFKLEYAIPVSNRIDIGIRGQLSLYPLEFQGIHQTIPANIYSVGFAGLGVFARFNW